MMKAVLLSLILSSVNAATRVAVIELGKGGAVQRTNSKSPLASVAGVSSFWSALHSPGRRLQHSGMALVPDLFNKASDGMVVGLKGSGLDLDTMPFVKSLVSDEGSNGVVGHFDVNGNKGDALLSKILGSEEVDASVFQSSCKKHAESAGLTGMITNVEGSDSASIDEQLREIINSLNEDMTSAGKTLVLHLVVEEEEGSARRRLLSRRLEDEEGEGEEENQDENEEGNQDANGNNGNAQQNNGYYGYGYYNNYGEWVTPYKTMFQIQYFNVVLWTSIGLTVILLSTIYLMVFMPLMPDTLLFGESAKMVGDD